MDILSVGRYCEPVPEDHLPDLKGAVKEACNQHVRRISRFVQLAILGASRCVEGQHLPARTGIYLASCHGDTGVATRTLEGLYRDRVGVSPLDFINSVSNAGCFYVAKVLNLSDHSHFVTSRFAPLNSALQIAKLDLESKDVDLALVGNVECCALPLDQHRERIGASAERELGEGSHWFLLRRRHSLGEEPAAGEKARGRVKELRSFPNIQALAQWCIAADLPRDVIFAHDERSQDEAIEDLVKTLGRGSVWAYSEGLPYFETQTGEALWAFIQQQQAPLMLHIDIDPAGKCHLLAIER